jgi:hypothetical protein
VYGFVTGVIVGKFAHSNFGSTCVKKDGSNVFVDGGFASGGCDDLFVRG